MGQDIEVFITTEGTRANNYVTVTESGTTAIVSGSSSIPVTSKVFAGPLSGSLGYRDDTINGTNAVDQVTGLDVSIGAMDEDITYFGFRQVTKAEIKKETTVSLSLKKVNNMYDAIFNGVNGVGTTVGGGRYGVTTSGASTYFHNGLIEPDVEYGYRIHVVLKDGTEVMSIPGCCVQSHTVTTAVDGSADETIEFMTYVTPSFGKTPDQVVLGATEI